MGEPGRSTRRAPVPVPARAAPAGNRYMGRVLTDLYPEGMPE